MDCKPVIISASRRSDIPALFGDWFIEHIERGFVDVKNPFNQETYRVLLTPDKVAAFVFWSKNFIPFRNKLEILEKLGYHRFIFNYTITGLPNEFEPNVPQVEDAVADFISLSRRYGREVMFWRFDPIIFSNITDGEYYIQKFRALASQIAPYPDRCIFSIAFFYNKVIRALRRLGEEKGVYAIDPDIEWKRSVALSLSRVADEQGIEFHACCCEYLLDIPGIKGSKCVDGELVSRMWEGMYGWKIKPSRKGCGCAESSDIGQYGTCKGGCVYCYAR